MKIIWNRSNQVLSSLPEKKELLKFAIDIGILVTYIMIEAVRPSSSKKYITDMKDSNANKEIEINLLPGEKRRQAELWVKNVINPYDILN